MKTDRHHQFEEKSAEVDVEKATTPDGVHSIAIGDIECLLLSDGAVHYRAEMLALNVPTETVRRALGRRLDAADNLLVPYGPQLIKTAGEVILVDTGIGDVAHAIGEPAGRLRDSLDRLGYVPDDISIVALTHCHPDHIGGLTEMRSARRVPVFRNARHLVWASEWDFWTTDATLAQLPDFLAAPAREHLPVIADGTALELLKSESELAPGVRIETGPGHTPGHAVLRLSAGGETVLLSADALLDEINFAHPDWYSAVDALPEAAVATRKRLLEQAARDNSIFVGYHLSRAGRVHKSHRGFQLEPLAS